MICLIALIIFGILAIFSASYRPLAKEAFDCVLRKVTFRKCKTNLDERLKSQLTGKLMTKSPKVASFTYKHFVIISWIFTLLLIGSLAYSAYSVYNYVQYGNCYGPEDTGAFCPLTALSGEQTSNYQSDYSEETIFPSADDDPSIGPEDAKVTVIEFGCYMCPYTKKAEPIVKELLKEYEGKIRFVFRDFPLPQHSETNLHAIAANCANEQGKFWEYHDELFNYQEECRNSTDHKAMVIGFANDLSLDINKFESCLASDKYLSEVENDIEAGKMAKIKGTPTFFINNRTIIGPKPIKAFKEIINEELRR